MAGGANQFVESMPGNSAGTQEPAGALDHAGDAFLKDCAAVILDELFGEVVDSPALGIGQGNAMPGM